jgi:hypothetical protein
MCRCERSRLPERAGRHRAAARLARTSTRVCWHMISETHTPYGVTPKVELVALAAAAAASLTDVEVETPNASSCATGARGALLVPAVEPLYGGASPRQGSRRRFATYHSVSAERTSSARRSEWKAESCSRKVERAGKSARSASARPIRELADADMSAGATQRRVRAGATRRCECLGDNDAETAANQANVAVGARADRRFCSPGIVPATPL